MKNTYKIYKLTIISIIFLSFAMNAQARSVYLALRYHPIVDAVYQVRPTAGGNSVLKLAEWNGYSVASAVVSNTGASYDVDMKVGPLSGKIYMFYVERNTFPPYVVKLDTRVNISTSLGVNQFPLPAGLAIKSLAIAVKTVGTAEEVHAVVLAETTTQARVYYARLTATGWTTPIIPYAVAKSSKRFGTNVKMAFVSPTSTDVMITYPELESTIGGTLGNIVTWKFNTALTAFPATPFLRTPANMRVSGGEIVNSPVPRVEPMDFVTDTSTGNTVIAATPARNLHDYPDAGTDIYSGNSLTSVGFVRTLFNTPTTGPWGSGALTLALSGTQRVFKLVALEQGPGTNLASAQLGLGGKEIKIYTSPQGVFTSQLIDGLPYTNAQPYFMYPAVTTADSETFAGVIYDNNGPSASCSGPADPLCHQVRVYSYNGMNWGNVKLDSAPTVTHKIEKLKMISR